MESLKSCFASLRKPLDFALDLIIIVSVVALVIDVLWGVVTRFVIGEPSRWTEEIARFLLMWVALLGAAAAFRHHEHLGFDYLVNQMDSGARRLVSISVHLVTLTFVFVVMVLGGSSLAHETLAVNQVTPALGLKMGYVYLALPISGLFILFYQLESLLFGSNEQTPLAEEPSQNSAAEQES